MKPSTIRAWSLLVSTTVLKPLLICLQNHILMILIIIIIIMRINGNANAFNWMLCICVKKKKNSPNQKVFFDWKSPKKWNHSQKDKGAWFDHGWSNTLLLVFKSAKFEVSLLLQFILIIIPKNTKELALIMIDPGCNLLLVKLFESFTFHLKLCSFILSTFQNIQYIVLMFLFKSAKLKVSLFHFVQDVDQHSRWWPTDDTATSCDFNQPDLSRPENEKEVRQSGNGFAHVGKNLCHRCLPTYYEVNIGQLNLFSLHEINFYVSWLQATRFEASRKWAGVTKGQWFGSCG